MMMMMTVTEHVYQVRWHRTVETVENSCAYCIVYEEIYLLKVLDLP